METGVKVITVGGGGWVKLSGEVARGRYVKL